MLPVQIRGLFRRVSRQLFLEAAVLTLVVVALHPEQRQGGGDENRAAGGEVEPVPDVVVWCVPAEEAPRGDESTDVAEHDCGEGKCQRASPKVIQMCPNQPDETRRGRLTICADRRTACCVTHDVCAHLRVCEGTEHEGGCGDDESGAVAHLGVLAGQEHDITDHYEGGGTHDENLSPVDPGADERQEQREEGTDDVRGNCVQLLLDDGLFRVDGLDDRRQEEGQALDSDIVEQEDEGCGQCDGVEDAAEDLGLVNLVEDLCLPDTLGLDAGDGEVFLLLAEPAGGFGSVGEGEERNEREANCDDALYAEDHAPRVQTAKARQLQDRRRKKPTKCTCQGCHDNV